MARSAGTGQPNVNGTALSELVFPLPPLTEQRRIVEKVNQLMALCDELEERQHRRVEARVRLNRASLHHLTAATDDAGLATHWQRIRDNFHRLYDAPETVTELRQAILQLAVRGKLVPQDFSDEPTSVLLERIEAEKQRLYKAGKIGKPATLPPVRPNDMPFDVPEGWAWVRLGVVVDQRLGKMLDKSKNKGDLHPYLRNTNVQWLRFDLADIKEMRFQPAELEEYGLEKGDLLVCEGGEPGRCAIWPGGEGRVMFQKALHRVRPFTGVDPWFVLYNLRADALSGLIAKYFTGATIKHMTGQALTRYVLPLPPTAEQRRIVRKVDQLMALCDELEAKLTRSRTKAERLASAVVHHLTAA
jgi:type I restriction enzyme S subunit